MDEPTAGKPLILVVEEDSAVRRFLEIALSGNGFNVLTAASGEEGLAIYSQRPGIALVLMDVQMVGLDGADTLLAMQQVDASICCCFMTGDTSLSRSKELLKIGAKHIFSKPFLSMQDLVGTLRQVLERAEP